MVAHVMLDVLSTVTSDSVLLNKTLLTSQM